MKILETLPPVPRPVQIRPLNVLGRIVLWLLLVSSLIAVPVFASMSVARLRTLMLDGKTLHADLTSAYTTQNKGTSYHMSVSFTAGGKAYSGSFIVTEEFYDEYQNATTVPVVTMPSDPGNFEIGSVGQSMIDA